MSMDRRCRTVIAAVCAALLPGILSAQDIKDDELKTTLCELVKHPDQFDGRVVRVRGTVRANSEVFHLMDAGCDAYIWLLWHRGTYNKADAEDVVEYAYINSRSEIGHPEDLNWKPVEERRPITLYEDEASRRVVYYTGQFYSPKGVRGRCHDSLMSCPSFEVEATVSGRFDHRDIKMRAIRLSDHPGEAHFSSGGFGHLGSYESQLAVESFSDVVARPIPRSTYEKRR